MPRADAVPSARALLPLCAIPGFFAPAVLGALVSRSRAGAVLAALVAAFATLNFYPWVLSRGQANALAGYLVSRGWSSVGTAVWYPRGPGGGGLVPLRLPLYAPRLRLREDLYVPGWVAVFLAVCDADVRASVDPTIDDDGWSRLTVSEALSRLRIRGPLGRLRLALWCLRTAGVVELLTLSGARAVTALYDAR